MSALRLLVVGLTVGPLAAGARAEDKTDYAKMLVGTWEVIKADAGTIPVGATVEFTKDGKINFTGQKDGADAKFEGTYKVEKNTFTMTMKLGDEEKARTITITRMTDKEMSTKDPEDRVVELKKK